MIVGVTIRDYYLQYIHKYTDEYYKCRVKLKDIAESKDKVYIYLTDNKVAIKQSTNIDLNEFIEYSNKEYTKEEFLYKTAYKTWRTTNNTDVKTYTIQIVKYAILLREENDYNTLYKTYDDKRNMKYSVYREYVAKYYSKVQEIVLNGDAYKFSYGIGTFYIRYIDMSNNKKKPCMLDYSATKAKKKELIAKGLKPYDRREAAWYAARKIPYDGIDYKVYRSDAGFYAFEFFKSKYFSTNSYAFKHTEYINNKYRGKSYTQVADEHCATDADVYGLQVDIKYKLNILLYRNPANHLKFIRNAS